jgi:D-sedoheptulose 7-phosphate isomerase
VISIESYFSAHTKLFSCLDYSSIERAISLIDIHFRNNRKIITCGNGGSALTASHYITDWNKMINLATGMRFRGISLCDNVGLVTAYGNDLSYEEVFAGQLKAIMDEDDLLVAISGSGNSQNVINAVDYANRLGAQTLAFVGYDGGQLGQIAKHVVLVPSFDMQLCEDIHLMLGHMVMKSICGATIKS